MGSIVSQNFYDPLLDESNTSSVTTASVEYTKILPREFDPRSPSANIDRTPIQCIATPMRLDDPRSPSMEIDRTPIYRAEDGKDRGSGALNQAGDKDEEAGTGIPPFNITESDTCIAPVFAEGALDSDIVEFGLIPPLVSSSDENRTVTQSFAVDSENSDKILTVVESKGDKEQLKTMFLAKSPKNPSSRSPLGTWNVPGANLRSIVQIREAQKVEERRTMNSLTAETRLRKGLSGDKENL